MGSVSVLLRESGEQMETKDEMKTDPKIAPKKQGFNWFRKGPNTTIFLAGVLGFIIPLIIGIIIETIASDSLSTGLIVGLGIAWLVLNIYCLIVCGRALKQKGRSIWWVLLILIPFICGYVLSVCGCIDEARISWIFVPVGWVILMILPRSTISLDCKSTSNKQGFNWFREHLGITVILLWLILYTMTIGLAFAIQPQLKNGPGIYFEYQADFSSVPQQNQREYLKDTMQIIENRLTQAGYPQFQVIKIGPDRIVVQLPGDNDIDIEATKQMVGTTAKLVFMEQATGNTSTTTAAKNSALLLRVKSVSGFGVGDMFVIGFGATAEPQTIAAIDAANMTFTVTPGFAFNHSVSESVTNQWTPATGLLNGVPTVLSGKYLLPKCVVVSNTVTNQPEVQFQWNADGANLFSQITANLIGKPLGIALDNEILSHPTVQAQISDTGVITGLTVSEAQRLAIQLNTGALPLTLHEIAAYRYLFWSGRLVTQNGSVLYCTFNLSGIPGDKNEDKLDYICETVTSHFKAQKNIEPCIYVMETWPVVNVGDIASMIIYLPVQLPDNGISIMSTLSLSHVILETYDYTVFATET